MAGLDVDALLEEAGSFHAFQYKYLLLLGVPWITCGCLTMVHIFVAIPPAPAEAPACPLNATAPLPAAVPLQQNITKCLAAHCVAQVKACVADAKCKGGITCMEKCPKPPAGCMKNCIRSALDQAMLEVGICAESSGCIPASTNVAALRAEMITAIKP